MEKGIVLPSFYLAPIAYYAYLSHTWKEVLLEKYEHFPKQTYRNRASIHSPNGRLDMIIPILKSKGRSHTPMKDVRISSEADWQRQHWIALQTCYRRSAYFEYYEDGFARFYTEKFTFLLDFNERLNELILDLLGLDVQFSYTKDYNEEYSGFKDCRKCIHPKKAWPENPSYFQVFEPKNGFIPNLSVVDLLFSQGPRSKDYLRAIDF